jgi:hypothetical protein
MMLYGSIADELHSIDQVIKDDITKSYSHL